MTQFPHDEFDDVPPYSADEVGKHRAQGAAAGATARAGGLKWIALLAIFALLVGLGSWLFSQFESDDAEPTADDQATTEEEPGAEADGAAEAGAEGDGQGEGSTEEGAGDAADGEGEGSAEEGAGDAADGEGEAGTDDESDATDEATEDDVDTDFPIVVYNFDGTEGAAGAARSQLEGAGFTVVDQQNWTQGWTTCEQSTPVVVHGPDREAEAAAIAESFGASTCSSDGWSGAGSIAVVVGAESLQ